MRSWIEGRIAARSRLELEGRGRLVEGIRPESCGKADGVLRMKILRDHAAAADAVAARFLTCL